MQPDNDLAQEHDDHRDVLYLQRLAERCDHGATELLYEADHAAEVLADRAGGAEADPQEWAGQKRAAAAAATRYAETLRGEAAELTATRGRTTAERIAQAERVAAAAELGGILIDGRASAARNLAPDQRTVWNENEAQSWDAGTHPTQEKAAEIEAAGVFVHVAETIGGHEQVPFWRLGTDAANEQAARAEDAAVAQEWEADLTTPDELAATGANTRADHETILAERSDERARSLQDDDTDGM